MKTDIEIAHEEFQKNREINHVAVARDGVVVTFLVLDRQDANDLRKDGFSVYSHEQLYGSWTRR